MTTKMTPMLRQYTEVKKQYPDIIVMFRLGDFYEMFGDDAVKASKELDIVLTSRSQGYAAQMPMCGVPHHAVDRYIARLIQKGHRVAICEQMEDPKLAKGIVKRSVTRVVTPGTVLEDGMLDAKSNNYLAAVVSGTDKTGIAVVDVSTGEFAVTELNGKDSVNRMYEEMARLSPAECLVHEIDQYLDTGLKQATDAVVTRYEMNGTYRLPAKDLLNEHFNTVSLRGFGCEDMTSGLEAAAMVLDYLKKTNEPALARITSLASYSTSGFMVLDSPARRNLELTQSMSLEGRGLSLLSILDKTKTAMGGRLIRKWMDQPLLDVNQINQRLDAVEVLYRDALVRGELRDTLNDIQDMERLMSRIVAGSANARDLVALKNSLKLLPQVKAAVSGVEDTYLLDLSSRIDSLDPVVELIEKAIADEPPMTLREGGMIREGYNEQLDELRDASSHGKEWIAKLENDERERTGIKALKVGYNSVFGYYIEVSKSNQSLVPQHYIRKQTTVNGERFITPELKEWEAKVLGAEEKATELEYKLFNEVREKVADDMLAVARVARAVAELDVLASLAEVAASNGYVRPIVDDGEDIIIKAGRHAVVEKSLPEGSFIPNDTILNCEEDQLLIITGPNMAGKSTYLRQVALIALMAQMGGFVPADHAKIGVVDRIFTRVGAHDELASGQSTFMVEMNETANILNNATRRSLIVLDEIGRGTSTYDGLSIAWAVAEEIKRIGAKTLFATHYHHLNDLERDTPGVRNYRIAVREEKDRIIWLRKIVPGGTDRSYGIEVARLAGLPGTVIERAKDILQDLEAGDNGGSVVGRDKEIKSKTQKVQLTLFEAERHPVLDELEKLDTSTMTPIEALTILYELQKKAKQQ